MPGKVLRRLFPLDPRGLGFTDFFEERGVDKSPSSIFLDPRAGAYVVTDAGRSRGHIGRIYAYAYGKIEDDGTLALKHCRVTDPTRTFTSCDLYAFLNAFATKVEKGEEASLNSSPIFRYWPPADMNEAPTPPLAMKAGKDDMAKVKKVRIEDLHVFGEPAPKEAGKNDAENARKTGAAPSPAEAVEAGIDKKAGASSGGFLSSIGKSRLFLAAVRFFAAAVLLLTRRQKPYYLAKGFAAAAERKRKHDMGVKLLAETRKRFCNLEKADYLIREGADMSVREPGTLNTSLIYIAAHGHTQILERALDTADDAVLAARNAKGMSAIEAACNAVIRERIEETLEGRRQVNDLVQRLPTRIASNDSSRPAFAEATRDNREAIDEPQPSSRAFAQVKYAGRSP